MLSQDDTTSPQVASAETCAGPVGVSVGIFAYNEEALIGHALHSFLHQQLRRVRIREMVVSSSGSTDQTSLIARRVAETVPILRVVDGPRRLGKLAAIAEFTRIATEEFVIIAAGDTVPAPDLVERLVRTLIDEPGCGMSGPRPVPAPQDGRLVHRLNAVLWDLHHVVALRAPKLSEILAIRRDLVLAIPQTAFCDEVVLESAVISKGAHLRYVPEAVVENFSPLLLSQFYGQRRRIHCQHLRAARALRYRASTFRLWSLVSPVASYVQSNPRELIHTTLVTAFEIAARIHGRIDHWRGLGYREWEPVRRWPAAGEASLETGGIDAGR
jgi:cellulose synthase/poly-beta-1,6-N-acetylglucosamine synthase-like glycosyltransferase